MNNLTVINQNGKLLVDSREVAEMLGKPHKELLKSIRIYIEYLGQGDFPQSDFFVESFYKNLQNKSQPCFLLTRKGCDLVANKMTGEKGVLFTAVYVTKFDEMEQSLKSVQPKLSKEIQAIFILDEKTQIIETRVDKLESDMPLFNVECKELQALVKRVGVRVLGGNKSPAYKDNSLRGRVYSDIQHQLKREFGVERYEAIKRSKLDVAKDIVESYKIPMVLESEIENTNRQINIAP